MICCIVLDIAPLPFILICSLFVIFLFYFFILHFFFKYFLSLYFYLLSFSFHFYMPRNIFNIILIRVNIRNFLLRPKPLLIYVPNELMLIMTIKDTRTLHSHKHSQSETDIYMQNNKKTNNNSFYRYLYTQYDSSAATATAHPKLHYLD